MKKVVLGLSGGVDSCMAALLLSRAGYEVVPLYLDAGLPGGAEAARRGALALGLSLEVADIRRELEERVCAPFARGYLRGETPNPCVICNPEVKLAALCRHADLRGAPFIATGHYAHTQNSRLYKGAPANDQSYMLCMVTGEQLGRLLLPLGGFEKAAVREMARREALPSAEAPDSMEICFVPDGDYAGYIERRGETPPPGDFLDASGAVLGRHPGIHHFTVGQRRGLGISAGERVYVSEIRPETNEVVLSRREDLEAWEIFAARVNWLVPKPKEPFTARVRIRHSREEAPAAVYPGEDGGGMRICFENPVRAPASGQAAAVYSGDELIAGGIIDRR